MKSSCVLVVQVVWVALWTAGWTPTMASLVLRRQRDVMMGDETTQTPSSIQTERPEPKIYYMHVTSHIEYRFANTLISSRVGNPANVSQEVTFSVNLPETAFISKFQMEIDGQVYEASVKEKQEAKQEYDAAVSAGLGAAHVAVSARDSNRFTVSVNVEPAKKVNFNLTYEELLARRLGAYNHVVNIDPGQVVADLRVDVHIKENTNITTLRVPELRSGNEVDADETTAANQLARIDRPSGREAHVSFAPSEGDQKRVGRVKGFDAEGGSLPQAEPGLGGQFVVQYDVDRSEWAGEVLVDNGYFVHFFAPTDLTPLPKHAIFVLDVSGSMSGRKMEQLRTAMAAILDELHEGDFFTIIEFSTKVQVWNITVEHSHDHLSPPHSPVEQVFPANGLHISKAKEMVAAMTVKGSTNIDGALQTALRLAGERRSTEEGSRSRPNPMILFLTDGDPTVGERNLEKIQGNVRELNGDHEVPIFSLAFGDDADLGFLKKLSLRNSGFARKIYEASDAALQLRDFYRQISSPLLANVTFSYQPDKVDMNATTKTRFPTLFQGSEIVVAGRMVQSSDPQVNDLQMDGQIHAESLSGHSRHRFPDPFPVIREEVRPVTSLERLWAYLTIKQLLDEEGKKAVEVAAMTAVEESTTSSPTAGGSGVKERALQLALQYSFVTPLTSLIVVKPNSTTEETMALDSSATRPHFHHTQPNGVYRSFSPRVGSGGGVISMSGVPASQDSVGRSLLRGRGRRPKSSTNRLVSDPTVTSTPPPPTTSSPAPELVSMDELTWLADISNNDTDSITLPSGLFPQGLALQLERNNQKVVDLEHCRSEQGVEGFCRHLIQCSLSSFKDDINKFKEFYCTINNYIGVCCPKSLFPQIDSSTTSTNITIV